MADMRISDLSSYLFLAFSPAWTPRISCNRASASPMQMIASSFSPLHLVLFLSLISFAQQQQESSWLAQPHINIVASSLSPSSQKAFTPGYFQSDDASALTTLAPAAGRKSTIIDQPASAVRAPPASQHVPSTGATDSQLSARSLRDWEVANFVLLATVDGTIHSVDRRNGKTFWELTIPSPMVQMDYHQPFSSPPEDTMSDDNLRIGHDFLWVVEPSQDGDLYIYKQSPKPGLQKLDLTVKGLVNQTPYSATQPPVTYTARKETTLYTLDARTGAILRMFSPNHQIIQEQETCAQTCGKSELCDAEGTITLGRVEYIVVIQNTERGSPICTIKFAEWTPNNRDSDLQNQHFREFDDNHIYSLNDGTVISFDHSNARKRRFLRKFRSPVARVFDVVRPKTWNSRPSPNVILPQPLQPRAPEYTSTDMATRDTLVFVNSTKDGGWFAMSELRYPLVTGHALPAEVYTKGFNEDGSIRTLSVSQQQNALVGIHPLGDPLTQVNTPALLPPRTDLTRPVPRDIVAYTQGRLSDDFALLKLMDWDWYNIVLTIIILFAGAFVYHIADHLNELAKSPKKSTRIPEIPRTISPQHGKPGVAIVSQTEDTDVIRNAPETATTPSTPHTPERLDAEAVDASSRSSVSPVPAISDQSQVQTPNKPKKKAHRGRRGGQAHKSGTRKDKEKKGERANTTVTGNDFKTSKFESESIGVDATRTSTAETTDGDGALRIGQLKVYTDIVLGHGSHGTVVYRGSYDGRDVAVKRLLVEFYDVASHEVRLLQESDDHSNVVRYYCREQSAGFLYIALELCPASLQELIENPQYTSGLVIGTLDLQDMFRQILLGIRHLHSLKIVHRDLKPQNILVSTPRKRGHAASQLRFLISDFGLCKRLEENQSSFRATTAHAAGTTGWRAPELLVSNEELLSLVSETQQQDTSEPAIVDPQTNRRATRAIDIFSLGCVFYYVLSGGGHPYDQDGRFMREANIVKGSYKLDALKQRPDAQESQDLVRSMISPNPNDRPDATTILLHPFFWSTAKRLSFLCDVSDHFEFEPRDPPSEALLHLESYAPMIIGADMDFLKSLPSSFIENLGKMRKYKGAKMLDMLRALRNKRNHYTDMPNQLRNYIGGLPDGYLHFWISRFPALLVCCHWLVLELKLTDTDRFRQYFTLYE